VASPDEAVLGKGSQTSHGATIALRSLVGSYRIAHGAQRGQVFGLEIEHRKDHLGLVPDALLDGSLLGIGGGVDPADDGGTFPMIGALQVVHLPLQDPADVPTAHLRSGGFAQSIPDEVEGVFDAVDNGYLAGTALLEQQAYAEYQENCDEGSEKQQWAHGQSVPTIRFRLARSTLAWMSVQTMSLFFALLAIAANAVTIGIVVIALFGKTSAGAGVRDQVFGAFKGLELWMAFAVAATATLGSLYLSDVAHFIPCTLCWYQRIAMYPLAIILLIAAVRRDHGIRIYVATLATIGAGIAFYHRLIQEYPSLEGGTSCDPSAPCTAAWIEEFGFITIPYMALSAFLLILALLWLDRFNRSLDRASLAATESEPS